MDDIIDKIYEQVINESCANPLRRFAELIRQDEREAIAKLCEAEYKVRLAETIRAREDKHD